LPDDPSLKSVVEAVESYRGRKILVKDLPLAPGLSGFCVRLEDLDLLVGTTRSSERRRIHVMAHELGHLLFDDFLIEDPSAGCSIASHKLIHPESLAAGLALLPADTVEKVRNRPIRMRKSTRNHLTDPLERLPETFALEVLSILRLDESTRGSGPIATAFGHRGTTL
jgi:Zn-dependent peptidase ImmA (M78 family)